MSVPTTSEIYEAIKVLKAGVRQAIKAMTDSSVARSKLESKLSKTETKLEEAKAKATAAILQKSSMRSGIPNTPSTCLKIIKSTNYLKTTHDFDAIVGSSTTKPKYPNLSRTKTNSIFTSSWA